MTEPLSAERFEQFIEAYTENHSDVVKHLDTIDGRLDSIETTLADHTKRLEHIEDQLTERQRIEKLEQRVRLLATLTGHPELSHKDFLPA